jgi:hypothetical protein
METRFGTLGSLKTAASESVKRKLDLVVVQEVKWVKGGNQLADDYIFSNRNGNDKHHLGPGFIIHKGITLAVKRV